MVNIGLEGMMLTGAFFAIWAPTRRARGWRASSSGSSPAVALALVHAVFAIHLRADQIVAGTAMNFLALGITGYVYVDVYGQQGTPTTTPSIPDVHLVVPRGRRRSSANLRPAQPHDLGRVGAASSWPGS